MTLFSPKTAVRRPRQPGWYIPWLLAAPFLVVFAANGTLVHYALSSFSGLTSEHASDEGAHYNLALAAAKAQADRGWQVKVTFTSAGGLRGRLDLDLRDRAGQPLTGAEVSVGFVRPTKSGADSRTRLVEDGGGRYGAEVVVPLPGVWDLRLEVTHATGNYQKVERVWLKG
ncbi:MAG: FixH family protein [Rhodospirillaceae bacterium]